MTDETHTEAGAMPESTESRFRRAVKRLTTPAAQALQLRLFAFALFGLSTLLAFNDAVFDFLSEFTEHPEILPVTFLVPLVYLIFQVVLWRLDRDEDLEHQLVKFEGRRLELAERLFDRRAMLSAFERGVAGLEPLDKYEGTVRLSEWIGKADVDAIEVKILSYSSETYLDGCLRAASVMRQTGYTPTRLAFLLLTRDLQAPWRLPFLPVYESDRDYRQALSGRFDQFLSRWKVEIPRAFDFLPRQAIQLEVRSYAFEPMYKLVAVNGRVGLVGAYDLHEVSHHGVAGWDYHGHGARSFEVRSTPGAEKAMADRVLVDYLAVFDEIWQRHSRLVERI